MTSPAAASMGLTSIVLPVHDQEAHVRGVVEAYVSTLQSAGFDFELLLVTNGCRDRSPEICDELAAGDARIRHIPSESSGWGAAVRLGLAAAVGDHLCYTNSARTTPEILALLLLYAKAYPEVIVKANRRVRDSRRRRLGSLIYNLECRALFDLSVWDINGTPKVFPRTFARLLELTRDDDLIDAEFAAVCREEGYPLVEVPILATVRYGGKSTTGLGSAVRMYLGAVGLWRERRRGSR